MTPSDSWHLDHDLAERYASGQTGGVVSASIEQHLIGCGSCRGLLAQSSVSRRSERIWAGVIDRIQAPPVRPLERILRRLGVADTTARLVTLTPSLRSSWIMGVVLVLVLAEVSAITSPSGVALFMALAPVLPVISVAAAFGGDMDPSREMVGAAPYPMFWLFLARTAAVVACALVPAVLLALLLPGSTWLALGWLLPSLALTSTVLVLTPRTPALPAAGALAAAWMALVASGWMRYHDPYLAASSAVQLTSIGILGITVALLAIRQEAFSEQIRRAS
jgi:hypothetical protein